MKRASTLFLKAVVLLISTAVLAFCIFSFPHVWYGAGREWPILTNVLSGGLIGIYAAAIPFLFAMYQAFRLLQYIDKNDAFSELSIRALSHIKYAAIVMSVCYAAALPLAYTVAELDDAPGLIIIATAFAGAPLIVATFAAVLQKLVRSALDMKMENDLTV